MKKANHNCRLCQKSTSMNGASGYIFILAVVVVVVVVKTLFTHANPVNRS